MKKSRVLALVLAIAIVASLTACSGKGSNTEKTAEATSQAEATAQATTEEKAKEPVTLRVLISDQPDYNNYPDNPVAKEIAKRTGVTLNFEYADKDRFNVILAGGDLPDIVRAINKDDQQNYKQLIEAGSIIPLDDLLQTNGKDILSQQSQMLDFSRKYWSLGQNKVYFLSTNIGQESYGVEQTLGLVVRWDYYKELGYPEIKNMDDYLNVLKQMQEKHPKTEDGKKVYGIGFWNDWGSWSYGMITSFLNRYASPGTYENQKDVLPLYTMPDGPQWSAVKWLNKANSMGLLDPDALIMTYNDLAAKATAGQILYAPATWPFQDFNGKHNKDGHGYVTLPLDWGAVWAGADWKAGWTDKGYSISKNSKYPDRAMDVLNFLWSYDGARLVYSGVQGEQWDLVDGKPVEKPDILALKAAGGDEWKKLQIAQNSTGLNYMVGFNATYINPNDNAPMSLFDSEDVYATNLNLLQKDYSNYYGVKYPSQAFIKKVTEGKMLDQKNINQYVASAMATQPTDISAINAKVDEAFIKAAAKAILAKSEAEYQKVFDKFVADANALGYPKYIEWYTKAWADARAAVGAN